MEPGDAFKDGGHCGQFVQEFRSQPLFWKGWSCRAFTVVGKRMGGCENKCGHALALWLGFVGLFRPAEILQLKVGDLSFSSPGGGLGQDPGLVVVIRNPKTRRIWHKQFVLCRDDRLERWLKWWVQGVPARRSLFNFSRYVWQKHFSTLVERLGLKVCGFTCLLEQGVPPVTSASMEIWVNFSFWEDGLPRAHFNFTCKRLFQCTWSLKFQLAACVC